MRHEIDRLHSVFVVQLRDFVRDALRDSPDRRVFVVAERRTVVGIGMEVGLGISGIGLQKFDHVVPDRSGIARTVQIVPVQEDDGA